MQRWSEPNPSHPTPNPRVILITGATSGIGRATALLLAALGHQVAAVGRRTDRLQELVDESAELFGTILPLVGDVTQAESIQACVGETVGSFGRLDGLIANAGIGHRGPLIDADWQDIDDVLQTNINGVLHSIRAAVPAMRASGGGHILTISSVVGPVPTPNAAIYSASKAAVDSLAQALRMELKADKIWVTNVLVGQTHTEFAAKRRGRAGKVASKLPTMTPEQVALRLAQTLERRSRTVVLRPLDRLIIFGGRFFPYWMDRLMYRVYR